MAGADQLHRRRRGLLRGSARPRRRALEHAARFGRLPDGRRRLAASRGRQLPRRPARPALLGSRPVPDGLPASRGDRPVHAPPQSGIRSNEGADRGRHDHGRHGDGDHRSDRPGGRAAQPEPRLLTQDLPARLHLPHRARCRARPRRSRRRRSRAPGLPGSLLHSHQGRGDRGHDARRAQRSRVRPRAGPDEGGGMAGEPPIDRRTLGGRAGHRGARHVRGTAHAESGGPVLAARLPAGHHLAARPAAEQPRLPGAPRGGPGRDDHAVPER